MIYMPPEMLEKRGYDSSVDVWAYGQAALW
jgi:serine/threonine protein kinase